jgi:hypothetical protein
MIHPNLDGKARTFGTPAQPSPLSNEETDQISNLDHPRVDLPSADEETDSEAAQPSDLPQNVPIRPAPQGNHLIVALQSNLALSKANSQLANRKSKAIHICQPP